VKPMSEKCPMCNSETCVKLTDYVSPTLVSGRNIIIKDVKILQCADEECQFIWLPLSEEKRIDSEVENANKTNE
jgi:hypothetical protein